MSILLILVTCLLMAVNGSPSDEPCSFPIENYPHVVSIEYDNVPIGGGSIISRYFVLTTAAVIFKSPVLDLLSVRTGSNFSNRYGQVHNVCDVKIHPNWTSDYIDYAYAVGLVRLLKPITFEVTRQPIRLFVGSDAVDPGTNVTLSLWRNIFVPGIESSVPLNLINASVNHNCTDIKYFGVFCIDRPFGAAYDRLTGRGHPVDVDGMQAGVVISINAVQDEYMYISDVGFFYDWIVATMKKMGMEKCSRSCDRCKLKV